MKATYISVWDGSVEVRSSCDIDTSVNPPVVSNIDVVDVDGLDSLDEELIELPDGSIITEFFNKDTDELVNADAS